MPFVDIDEIDPYNRLDQSAPRLVTMSTEEDSTTLRGIRLIEVEDDTLATIQDD